MPIRNPHSKCCGVPVETLTHKGTCPKCGNECEVYYGYRGDSNKVESITPIPPKHTPGAVTTDGDKVVPLKEKKDDGVRPIK